MKPSEIIVLRERLERLDMAGLSDVAVARQHDVSSLFDDYTTKENDFVWMDKAFNKLMGDLQTIEGVVNLRISELNELFAIETVKRIASDNSYWADNNVRFKTADYNRNYRQLSLSDNSIEIVRSRIGVYTDWQYPGLEIGPGEGEWTESLVACDPLFVVDYNDECLTTTKGQFNEKYQNRLRCYLNHGEDLHMLPQGQFGFVFSWNTFNYFSFNQISDYLKEIYKALRPGGACMFSYNNAERAICAQRAEDELMAFTPRETLIAMIDGFGFEQIKTQDVDSAVSWVEFRKPGKLETYRTGQTLGKIIFAHDVKA